MAISYVKFIRGTQARYNALPTKDKDTLYFTYENDSDQIGKLYLGNKLISTGSGDGTISISDVADIVVSEGITDGSVLVYDEAEGTWVNKTILEALEIATMIGASATAPGVEGLVPRPQAGDNDKFLRGDGTWVSVPTSSDSEAVTELQSTIATLVGTDTDKSVRDIAEAVLIEKLIPSTAKETLDSLEEIAQWIQEHPEASDVSDLQSRVEAVELVLNDTTTGEGEDAVITKGLTSQVSDLNALLGDLSNLKTTNEEGTELTFSDVSSNLVYLNTTMESVSNRLKWYELED